MRSLGVFLLSWGGEAAAMYRHGDSLRRRPQSSLSLQSWRIPVSRHAGGCPPLWRSAKVWMTRYACVLPNAGCPPTARGGFGALGALPKTNGGIIGCNSPMVGERLKVPRGTRTTHSQIRRANTGEKATSFLGFTLLRWKKVGGAFPKILNLSQINSLYYFKRI